MAIVLNLCLMMLLGIFDYGRFVMTRQVFDQAARDAARYATVNTAALTTSDIQTKALNSLGGQRPTGTTVAVYRADPSTGANLGAWTDAQLGEGICVEITGSYKPLLPTFSLLPSSIPLVAKSIMRSEAN